MTKVRISIPTKSAMQSGQGTGRWVIDFLADGGARYIDKTMGWTSAKDMAGELKLEFLDRDSAVEFAKDKGWDYEVIEPMVKKFVKKSYADNFK
jgi:hypothetical protein